MKEILRAMYALYFFKTYTYMDRNTEIFLGIITWLQTIILAVGTYNLMIKW